MKRIFDLRKTPFCFALNLLMFREKNVFPSAELMMSVYNERGGLNIFGTGSWGSC